MIFLVNYGVVNKGDVKEKPTMTVNT